MRLIRKKTVFNWVFGLLFTVGIGFIPSAHLLAADQPVHIGVLAKRGVEKCLEQWSPTARYLTDAIDGYSFSIVPLAFNEVSDAVSNARVEFILANSAIYVELEYRFGVNRIATLKNRRLGGVFTRFGGVVFCRAGRPDIQQLKDVQGKRFAAVDETSFGGWLMAWREFKLAGIDPHKDFKALTFIGTHDGVVKAVASGAVDAGTVRTDTLERMALEGKILLDDFHVIQVDHFAHEHLPFVHTTRLYPEWPMAMLRDTSIDLAETVADKLLEMGSETTAARSANCAGWTIPLNYQPVHECLKSVGVSPYEDYGKITIRSVVEEYWIFVVVLAVGFFFHLVMSLRIVRLNSRLRTSHKAMEIEVEERRQAQHALGGSEAKYRSMMKAMKDAVYICSPDFKVQYVNPVMEKTLGYDPVGKPCYEVILARGDRCPWCPMADIQKGVSSTVTVNHPSTGRSYEVTHSPVRYADGSISKLTIYHDITERVESENALKESRKRFSEMIENIQEGYYEVDLNGNFTFVNQAFCRQIGEKRDHVTGSGYGRFLAGDEDKERVFNTFQKVMESADPVNEFHFKSVRPDGQVLDVEASVTLIRNKNGKPMGFRGIVRDISLRKQVELDLLRAKEAAEETDRVKNEFLANMSHEIRTPLNGVIGFTDMLMDTDLDDTQQDFLKTIKLSGETLLSLINDFLDFSKAESGNLELEQMDFDLEVTAFDVCDLVSPRIGDKPVEIICAIDENLPNRINGDPARIRQVLLNLMGNAAKFTESGEIELSVALEAEFKDTVEVHVIVRDTGIGINEKNLARVFDPFQQADGSTTRKYGGTGLGLSICRKLVRLMNGEIWVESTLGAGSRFHFTAVLNKARAVNAVGDYFHQSLTDKKVLIVDDNLTNLNLLAHYLQQMHMQVTVLQAGAAVIDTLKSGMETKSPFHICISDIQMPDANGYEVASQVRESQEPFSSIPLLALSSMTRRDAKKCQAAGFDGFLSKPVLRNKLYRMVQRLIAGEKPDEKTEAIATQYSVQEEMKQHARILIVEDNPVNQKVAQIMMKKAGYRCQVAENGAIALSLYTDDPDRFDLLFMDMQMPIMDGLTATAEIRKWESADGGKPDTIRRVPIVAMTANAMPGDREKCLEAGMDDYVTKPIKREVIFETMKKWVFE